MRYWSFLRGFENRLAAWFRARRFGRPLRLPCWFRLPRGFRLSCNLRLPDGFRLAYRFRLSRRFRLPDGFRLAYRFGLALYWSVRLALRLPCRRTIRLTINRRDYFTIRAVNTGFDLL